MKRRRQRMSRPIPLDAGDHSDQQTIPLNIVSAEDWRNESEVKAVRVRTTWGKVLATRDRATDILGMPLRFVPATIAEIMGLWYKLGGPTHPLGRNPLVLVRISQSGLAPLILLSLFALNAMEERPEVADRLRVAIEFATSWLQDRENRKYSNTCVLLLDSGSAFPVAQALRDPFQQTPPPFHIVDVEEARKRMERQERREQFD